MNNVAHSIDTRTSLPFKSKPYQKSLTEETQVKKELGELLKKKLFQPSCSPWLSPLLLVKKKNGGHWVVMDYQRLNHYTKKDFYSITQIDKVLCILEGSKFFPSIDLASGYWQIELSKED